MVPVPPSLHSESLLGAGAAHSGPCDNGAMALSVTIQPAWVTKAKGRRRVGRVRSGTALWDCTFLHHPKAVMGSFLVQIHGGHDWVHGSQCTWHQQGFPRLWDVWGAGAGPEGQAGHQEEAPPQSCLGQAHG